MNYQNMAAIVTGGASGLGAATAELLAANGAKVTLFDLNEELGRKKAADIGGAFLAVDVTDANAVAQALETAEGLHGKARILVNCAGISPPAKTVDRQGQPLPLEAFAKVIQINLIGTFNVCSKFAARLIALEKDGEERGIIINTASVAAYEGQVGQVAYAASKGGVHSMALPMARDLSQYGIRVMTIAPGLFLTPMMATLSQEFQDSLGKQVPFPSRLGSPTEYAMLVDSIVRNPMLNGETIRLDGAIRMAPR